MISRDDVGDGVADLLDHSGGLVTEHCRKGNLVGAFHEPDVAVAETCRRHPDDNLERARLRVLDVFDAQ
jgi:hypothetical protein